MRVSLGSAVLAATLLGLAGCGGKRLYPVEGTVQYEDAFPNGGNRALLPGFDQEVWGLPVSRPVSDAQNPDIVLLRWERGVMAWSRQTGTVTAIPLGDTFKAVLTGQGLGPERTAAAAGSPFLLQLDPAGPGGVARLARKLHKPVFAIVGRACEDPELRRIFDGIYQNARPGMSQQENMNHAAELLRENARELAHTFGIGL